MTYFVLIGALINQDDSFDDSHHNNKYSKSYISKKAQQNLNSITKCVTTFQEVFQYDDQEPKECENDNNTFQTETRRKYIIFK